MESRIRDISKKLKKMLESGEIGEFTKEYIKKRNIQYGRFQKFEKYLKTIDFDILIYRLVMEHGEEYREKCWANGFEAYPNNKLQFLFDYVVNRMPCVDVPKIKSDFNDHIYEFNDYYFQIIRGQGVIYTIYNGKNLQVVLQI